MKQIRRSSERGHADHGWLNSYHSFSFAGYHDPRHMSYGPLRVSYVLDGELAHKDSMGNGSTIRPGDVQRMSAGTGVQHSEFNPSKDQQVHFLQIWIIPQQTGIKPSYEEKRFAAIEKRGRLRLIASPDGADGSVLIHQDARIHAGLFDGAEQAAFVAQPDRIYYVHLASGELQVDEVRLQAGDALKVSGIESLNLTAGKQAEVLLFDLPAAAS